MKKVFSLFLLMVLFLNLVACNSNDDSPKSKDIPLTMGNVDDYLNFYYVESDWLNEYSNTMYFDVKSFKTGQAVNEHTRFVGCSVSLEISVSAYDSNRKYYSATGKADMKINDNGDGYCTIYVDLSSLVYAHAIDNFDISDVKVNMAYGTLEIKQLN